MLVEIEWGFFWHMVHTQASFMPEQESDIYTFAKNGQLRRLRARLAREGHGAASLNEQYAGKKPYRSTPLTASLEGQHWDVARALIDHGASPTICNPAFRACSSGAAIDLVLELFTLAGNPNATDHSLSMIAQACSDRRRDLVVALLQHESGCGMNAGSMTGPCQALASNLDDELIHMMLDHASEPARLDAVCRSKTLLCMAVRKGNQALVHNLVGKRGADLSLGAIAPLSVAADTSNNELAQYLISSGANVDLQTSRSWTALHFAAYQGAIDVTKSLLTANADVTLQSIYGGPLHIACQYGRLEIVKLLVQHVTTLPKLSVNSFVNTSNERGWMPLHYASVIEDRSVADFLLSHKADPNCQTLDGDTPDSLFQECLALGSPQLKMTRSSPNSGSAYDFLLKFIVVGASGVGKSCFLLRLTDDAFSASFITTIGIDFKILTLQIGNTRFKYQIWDTAGQERFRTITTAYYRGAQAVVIMYDVTDERSFSEVRVFMNQIEQHATESVSKIIVGNKIDMKDRRQISFERGVELANEYGVPYYETSCVIPHSHLDFHAVLRKLSLNIFQNLGVTKVESMKVLALKESKELEVPVALATSKSGRYVMFMFRFCSGLLKSKAISCGSLFRRSRRYSLTKSVHVIVDSEVSDVLRVKIAKDWLLIRCTHRSDLIDAFQAFTTGKYSSEELPICGDPSVPRKVYEQNCAYHQLSPVPSIFSVSSTEPNKVLRGDVIGMQLLPFAMSLYWCSFVTSIDLAFSKITPNGLEALCTAIMEGTKSVSHLHLAGNNLGSECGNTLSSFVSAHGILEFLSIAGNPLGDRSCLSILGAAQSSLKLTELDMSNCGGGPLSAEKLLSISSSEEVHEMIINYNGNDLTDDQFRGLQLGVHPHVSLTLFTSQGAINPSDQQDNAHTSSSTDIPSTAPVEGAAGTPSTLTSLSSYSLPGAWTLFRTFKEVELKPTDLEFGCLQDYIFDANIGMSNAASWLLKSGWFLTDKSKYWPALNVSRVTRIQNEKLWRAYSDKRDRVLSQATEEFGSPTMFPPCKYSLTSANEALLFHGTSVEIMEKIIHDGFDEHYAGILGAQGRGIYFTDSIAKALDYTPCATCGERAFCSGCGTDREFVLIVARVLLGRSHVALDKNRTAVLPPGGYHSVTMPAQALDPRSSAPFSEFVVYYAAQTIPLYVVRVEKVSDTQANPHRASLRPTEMTECIARIMS